MVNSRVQGPIPQKRYSSGRSGFLFWSVLSSASHPEMRVWLCDFKLPFGSWWALGCGLGCGLVMCYGTRTDIGPRPRRPFSPFLLLRRRDCSISRTFCSSGRNCSLTGLCDQLGCHWVSNREGDYEANPRGTAMRKFRWKDPSIFKISGSMPKYTDKERTALT